MPAVLERACVMCDILPQPWLRYILRHTNSLKQFLNYVKSSNKLLNCKYRLDFLKNCNNNIIPDLLRFRIPKNEVFSDQAVHSFQLKLLRKEISRAEQGRRLFEEKLGEDRGILRKEVKKELLLSIVYSIRKEMRDHSELIRKRLNDKLVKLSERQDRPLRNGSHNSVVTLDGVELPKFVLDVLSLGPKHPVRDKFNEVHFLADVDRLVRELRENNTDGEKLCEIESSAKWYAKNVRETPMDRGVKKANDFLKDQKLLAVPFHKGCGFSVMKQTTYSDKLNEILSSSQFEPRNGESDDLTIRTDKLINSSLDHLMKQGKISEKIYHRLRTTGLQPATLYGLAKVHKIGTPLGPVLSVPGSSYENLNKFFSPFFWKLPGANIETNSKDARAALEATKLDEDELMGSLDVKSLYTNVTVEEAIEIALKNCTPVTRYLRFRGQL